MELKAAVADLQKQFLASLGEVRPKLHRFCARMCGSALDGEDVVQETLAQAFFRLPSLQEPSRMEPWLFRIAHRKCIDFLRSREELVEYDDSQHGEIADEPISEKLTPLITQLPPKERAAVLLKDVLQYRLSEVAEVVESTVGGVKAALHRGREKLRSLEETPPATLDARDQRLLDAYVECFNRRDWSALTQLIAADARLEVVDAFDGKLSESPYFGNYASLSGWQVSVALVDGESVLVLSRDGRAKSAIRLWWRDGKVVRIRDYFHVQYLLEEAKVT